MIIGAAKCGTTSLFHYLCQSYKKFHGSYDKETRYFSEFNHLPLSYYKAQFTCFPKKISIEATPDYIFYHKAPEFIKKAVSNCKFILILRNPIDRAWSQYKFQRSISKSVYCDPLSFSDAIRQEESRLYIDDKVRFFSEYKHITYVSRGLYYEQLKRWFSFFPPETTHVMFLENLITSPAQEIFKLNEFLGIPTSNVIEKMVWKNKSNTGHMSLDDQAYLRLKFEKDSLKLFKLLNQTPLW